MSFTRSSKIELGITDLSQYTIAFTNNILLDEASFELRIVTNIVE